MTDHQKLIEKMCETYWGIGRKKYAELDEGFKNEMRNGMKDVLTVIKAETLPTVDDSGLLPDIEELKSIPHKLDWTVSEYCDGWESAVEHLHSHGLIRAQPEAVACGDDEEDMATDKFFADIQEKFPNALENGRKQLAEIASRKSQPQLEAAKVALDFDNAREVFENWLTADGNYPHLKHKSFGGQYLHEESAMKWDGFKAGYYALQTPASDTPPQSPNRAVLDALKSIIFDIECLEPIKKMHLEDAYQAISDAEKECVDYETEIREFISEQFKEDGTPYITEEKNCILLGMPVDANTADWFTKLRAFEHLKRQKGR